MEIQKKIDNIKLKLQEYHYQRKSNIIDDSQYNNLLNELEHEIRLLIPLIYEKGKINE